MEIILETAEIYQLASYLILLLLLLIALKPLYKLSRTIDGIFWIFIDCTLQITNTAITLVNTFSALLVMSYCTVDAYYVCKEVPVAINVPRQILLQLNGVCHDCIFGLLITIALNRFHAIFFPFTYNRFWKPRKKRGIILLAVLLQAICFRMIHLITGLARIYFYTVVLPYYLLCLGLPLLIYLMILIKFTCWCNCNARMDVTPSELRQDRIRIAFVCFLTLFPWLWQQFSVSWPTIKKIFVPPIPTADGLHFRFSESPVVILFQMVSQLSHVIGITVLNRQFRQLLRTHVLTVSGFRLLSKLFKRMNGTAAAVHPIEPLVDAAAAATINVRPAPEVRQFQDG